MAVFIIAEAGVNHNGDINLAKKLIDSAKEAGADAVKFQSFKASRLVTASAEKADYQLKNTGCAENQYEMLRKLELSAEAHKYLKEYCDKVGIIFLSTPFDFESTDLLNSLNVPMYKISSGDLTNIPFLKYIAKRERPIILSTGMSDLGEIEEALTAIYSENNKDITLLHCTTSYPAPYQEVNLKAMLTIREAFKTAVGYSDHTEGIEIAIAAAAMGASVIEKHFTLDRRLHGPDHKASIEPDDLRRMVTSIRNVERAMGDGCKRIKLSEADVKKLVRKSVVAGCNIKKGSIISEEALALKRPADGIEPKFFHEIVGKIAKNDIMEDAPIKWCDIE